MRRKNLLALALTASLLFWTRADAALIGLTLEDSPDILSQHGESSYDASADTYSVVAFAFEFTDDGGSHPGNGDGDNEPISNGTFTLLATIDDTGALVSGSLTIGGTIASLGANSGTLLTGSLVAFGFSESGDDLFEFTFDVTGGDLAPFWSGLTGGIILDNTGFGGTFASNFSEDFTAQADTGGFIPAGAEVPEPGSLTLLLTGLALGAARRRLRPGSDA